MTSAVAIAGRLGITAIGDSAHEARALYEAAQSALDDAAEVPPERRLPLPW
jgi:nicotinic acid phosphoribosyltransferase